MSPMGLPAYVPLWSKSNYSFLEGASHPEELVEEAQRLGIRSLAITDRDGVYGIARGHLRARELGFHLIIGAELSVEDGSHLTLLAQDREGYANLCRLISRGRLRCEKGRSEVGWKEICAHASGLIGLWGGAGSLLYGDPDPLFVARDLLDAFGDRLYALVVRHRRAEEPVIEARVRERAARFGLPVVAGNEILYHTPSRRCLQDVVTCLRHGVALSGAGTRIRPNAEYVLKSPHAFALLFEDDLAAVARTQEVAARCRFTLDEIRYRYPGERLPDGTTSQEWLRHLTWQGACERYGAAALAQLQMSALEPGPGSEPEQSAGPGPEPELMREAPAGVPAEVVGQIEKELALVAELDYDGYFLTMWEIVQFCRREGILCQGRGSAANSAVCYCLGITAVDPVRMGLLFERFLSRERAEPPDIDLDIEHDRREEVIQWVYWKYGRSHAAMVANFIRFRTRSAVREVGKVLGFAETELDRLAKLLPNYGGITSDSLRQAGLDAGNPMHQQLLALVLEIQDFPRHLSIHPGGFLLGHEPIDRLVPVENATMEDRTVIQWDKEDLENLGLFKIDLLGLGALRQLHLAFDLVRAHHGHELSMATIPADDARTYEMIRQADTVGVFQIESRAQMAMLPRLRPRNYYDLVIEVSIVRPGPIAGGMVHPYLRRRNGEEEVVYPHECLVPVLEKTLGVPLFQEQVMKLAVVAADYTPGEADRLRRDMAAWRSTGRIERHREVLVARMKAKGIAEEFAVRVFEQIRGFGEYGFPESHAASFALIAYATAWVRAHYLDAFTCALLNAYPMGFYTPATILEDARRHGVRVLPPDVLASGWECRLERGASGEGEWGASGEGERGASGEREWGASGEGERGRVADLPTEREGKGASRARYATAQPRFAVRLGLRYIKGLGERERQAIDVARESGAFRSIEDFARRTGLETRVLQRLAEAGAFQSFEAERRQALWKVRALQGGAGAELEVDSAGGRADLVAAAERASRTPPRFLPLTGFEEIAWDYQSSDLSTRGHPLLPFRSELQALGLPDAATVNGGAHGTRVRYAGVVINRQRPGTAGGVTFMTLEDETGFVNLVIWQPVYERFRLEVKTSAFLGVEGKLQVESGVVHLVADGFWLPELSRTIRSGGSRDFH